MCKKLLATFLMIHSLTSINTLICQQLSDNHNTVMPRTHDAQEIIGSEHKDVKTENCVYDELDFYADNPLVMAKPINVPHWVKAFCIGCILRIASLSTYWQESWKKIKTTFAQ